MPELEPEPPTPCLSEVQQFIGQTENYLVWISKIRQHALDHILETDYLPDLEVLADEFRRLHSWVISNQAVAAEIFAAELVPEEQDDLVGRSPLKLLNHLL